MPAKRKANGFIHDVATVTVITLLFLRNKIFSSLCIRQVLASCGSPEIMDGQQFLASIRPRGCAHRLAAGLYA